MPAGLPERSFVAKLPSVATSFGSMSSIWRKRCGSQAAISSGQRVAVPGRPAIVHDASGSHEIVGLLDIKAEVRSASTSPLSHVLDFDLVEEDGWRVGPEPRWGERNCNLDVGMELVAHRCRHVRCNEFRETPCRRHVEVDPLPQCLRRQAEPRETSEQDLQICVVEADSRYLRKRLSATRTDPQVAVVHEPDREHPLVELVREPGGNPLVLAVEVVRAGSAMLDEPACAREPRGMRARRPQRPPPRGAALPDSTPPGARP